MATKKDTKTGEKERVNQDILLRVKILTVIFRLLAILILARLVWICFSPEVSSHHNKLEGKVFRWQELPAHRGSILARDSKPLATSIFKYQIEMDYGSEGFDDDVRFKENVDSLSKLLSKYFKDKPASQYRSHMESMRKQRYKQVYLRDSIVQPEGMVNRIVAAIKGDKPTIIPIYDIKRDHTPTPLFPRLIDQTEWEELRKYPILNWNMGITYNRVESDERIYPQGELARRTIGKLLGDRGNDYGIESAYSENLAGTDGFVKRQRIARGFYGQVPDVKNVEPVDGLDVVTTIDINIQEYADRVLREQLTRHKGIWGTTIIMEVATGDILAIVNLGRTSSGNYIEDKNYALGSRIEPGSTFKLATTIALLDDAKMSPEKVYNSGKGEYIRVGKMRIRDSGRTHASADLKTAFTYSLNGYFANAAYDHYDGDERKFTDFLSTLHLDKSVGLDNMGALSPTLHKPGDKMWRYDYSLPYISCGYFIELTPLHTLTLYNAVANDGRMVAPRLIKSIKRGDKTVEEFPTTVLKERICSPSTLETVRSYLEEVSARGTANRYLSNFKNFSVASKTGTSQYSQGNIRYEDGYYYGSMVSYMPTQNPKYSIATAVYTKRVDERSVYYGAGLTGDVQKALVQYLYNRESEWYDHIPEGDSHKYPLSVKGGKSSHIQEIGKNLFEGANIESTPKWGQAKTNKDNQLTMSEITTQHGVMPDVVGLSLKDAIFLMESCGVKASFKGEGVVREQGVKAGTKVNIGTTINLNLR